MVPREIDVHDLKLVDVPDPDHAVFEATYSKKTYIQTLYRNITIELSTRTHVSDLRRTSVGPFAETDMVTLETLEENTKPHYLPIVHNLTKIIKIPLDTADTQKIHIGNPVLIRGNNAPIACDECFTNHKNKPVALGRIAKGQFHPKRVFNL